MSVARIDLKNAYQRILPYVYRTPVLRSKSIDEMTSCKVFFKCENFQRTGSFKMRGATNAILNLSDEQKLKGVITHSSGNFAQAISLAAKSLGVKAYVIMPSNASEIKKVAVKNYGGEITFSDTDINSRELVTKLIQEKTKSTFLHPSNQLNVILGQGTATIELLDQKPDLEFVLTPVGGGGLIAGTALASIHFSKECKVMGAEPAQADDAYRSLKRGTIQKNKEAKTIADGLRTHLGDVNFPIIKEHVIKIIRVDENEIVQAMKIIWNRLKIIIEPSSAVPFAALLKEKDNFKGAQVGIILSGGNVDLDHLPF
jgi:threonine dehydratase